MAPLLFLLAALAAAANAQATDVRFLGRVNPETRKLTWPATGVSFSFNGTSASVEIKAISGSNSVEMVVDGGEAIVTDNVVGSSLDTPTLAQGTHSVTVRKRSEASFGTITIGDVTVPDGSLIEADEPPARRIHLIGDSITVGYGIGGTNPCTNSAALEDATSTYGALAAGNLSAEYDIVAWSGIGVTRNYASGAPDTSPQMPERWTRYGSDDANDSYTFPEADAPDAVVINLGTNDFSYLGVRDPIDATVFEDARFDFAQTVVGHWPDAQLFLTSSPMLGDYWPSVEDAQHTTHAKAAQGVAARIGSNAHFVEFPTQGSDVGCDYHPSPAEHERMADILVAAIKAAVSW
jgi:lysophospholipase L1-like esterase